MQKTKTNNKVTVSIQHSKTSFMSSNSTLVVKVYNSSNTLIAEFGASYQDKVENLAKYIVKCLKTLQITEICKLRVDSELDTSRLPDINNIKHLLVTEEPFNIKGEKIPCTNLEVVSDAQKKNKKDR